MGIKFTRFKKGENWVSGEVDGGKYSFGSMLFDNGSPFGISGGRVSKLFIEDVRSGKSIVEYDRGWGIQPEVKEDVEVYNQVFVFLENAPKTRFK